MINLEELDVLDSKIIYNTNSDKYVVYEQSEKVLASVDFKMLGLYNDYSYSYQSGYLVKRTLNGDEIARIYLEVDHGKFKDNFHFAYYFKDKKLYKVSDNLEILWEVDFDDYIRTVEFDANGDVYILFKNSRAIRKYNTNGEYIYYLDDSDDPTKYCRLYDIFISEGMGHLYVIGSEFYNDSVVSFVDHYDTRKCEKIKRTILCSANGVKLDDPYYEYNELYIDGDFIYVYSNFYIEKLNLKLRSLWKYGFGYNHITGSSDCLSQITFSDENYKNYIHFCENFKSSNGYSFGKLSKNGDLLWKITNPENLEDIEFNVCIYKGEIYITTKREVDAKKSYVLSLDNNRVLFETRDGNLVRIVEPNYDELFSPDNYIGRYLVGRKIKDGVSKYNTFTLLHDTGSIFTENDEVLLLDEPNTDYNNPDNYEYFRLVGTEVLSEDNEYTVLVTPSGQQLLSFNNSYIETLYPYSVGETNQYLVKSDGTFLRTEDDIQLVRSAGIFASNFYLLADEHMFHQDIITKKEGKVILTKKKEFSIAIKRRRVYRYVLKRLLDIDIIVEHLQQNNILETMIPSYVDKLRHHRVSAIMDMQKALSPTLFDIEPCKRYSYKYDGYDYPIRYRYQQIFMCKNIPYIKKNYTKSIFIKPLIDCINEELVVPFLVFINGQAIKWSNITIVRDWSFSYLLIENTDNDSDKLESVILPCVIRYGEDSNILPNPKSSLYFTSNGRLTENVSEIDFRVEILDKDVIGETQYITDDKPYIDFPNIDSNQLADVNNILVFEEGLFFGESRFYLDQNGKNVFTYDRELNNTVFKTFYFDKANDSKNMINALPKEDEAKQEVISQIETGEIQPTVNFLSPFDFTLSREKSYLRNISEATAYILQYRMQLLIDFYRDQSNIKTYQFDGERVLTLASKNGGWLVMPRTRKNNLFDYIIVFLNDRLYRYQGEIEYENRVFKIPIFDHVKQSDKLEILHFMNVDNTYSSLTIDGEDDYIAAELRYDNFELFANSPTGSDTYDSFSVENSKQYKVDFDFRNNFNRYGKYESTTIQLSDPYFYGKKLNICAKRQFRQMYYNVLTDNRTRFDLDPQFAFCHNKSQFMVFVNSIKLNSDEFYLRTYDTTTDEKFIYIETVSALNTGDLISIFYIPDAYEEFILNKHLTKHGDIIMDVSDLDYPFDNQLFLIFVDGKKILTNDIQNISSNRVRIKTTQKEKSNVCVCRYLNPDAILQKIFSYGDLWTKSTESLPSEEYENLFIKAKN